MDLVERILDYLEEVKKYKYEDCVIRSDLTRIVEEQKAEFDRDYDSGYDDGYKEGFENGYDEGLLVGQE